MPPAPRRRSWVARLSPEVRIIGLVVIIGGIAALIVLWPRQEKQAAEALTVVIPASEPWRLAFHDAARSFMRTHKDTDVVPIEAEDEKTQAYEAMWRKGKSGVDLVIGAEGYLNRWSRAGLLDPWDQFLGERNLRLATASLDAGRVGQAQSMLPVALELSALRASLPAKVATPGSLDDLAALAAQASRPGEPALGGDWSGEWAEATLLATAHAGGETQNLRMALGRTRDALAWWRKGIAAGWARKPGPGTGQPPLLWAGQRAWFEAQGDGKTQLLLPPGAADTGTICVVYGAVLPAQSRHKDAARLFADKVLMSQEFQIGLARRTGLLPALIKAWPKVKGPGWEALRDAAARSFPLPPELRSADVVEPFARAANGCLAGRTSPDAAAAAIGKLSGAAAAP
jgi:hypothetical protein